MNHSGLKADNKDLGTLPGKRALNSICFKIPRSHVSLAGLGVVKCFQLGIGKVIILVIHGFCGELWWRGSLSRGCCLNPIIALALDYRYLLCLCYSNTSTPVSASIVVVEPIYAPFCINNLDWLIDWLSDDYSWYQPCYLLFFEVI